MPSPHRLVALPAAILSAAYLPACEERSGGAASAPTTTSSVATAHETLHFSPALRSKVVVWVRHGQELRRLANEGAKVKTAGYIGLDHYPDQEPQRPEEPPFTIDGSGILSSDLIHLLEQQIHANESLVSLMPFFEQQLQVMEVLSSGDPDESRMREGAQHLRAAIDEFRNARLTEAEALKALVTELKVPNAPFENRITNFMDAQGAPNPEHLPLIKAILLSAPPP